MRRRAASLAAALSAALWAAACGEEPPPEMRQRGIPRPPQVATAPAPAPAPSAAPEEPQQARTRDDWRPSAAPRAGAASPPQTETAIQEGAGTRERALSDELMAQLKPASCLDMQAAAARPGGLVELRAQGTVMPSGRVTRASATASGQPERALRCLSKQLEAARLRPPIEDAPRRVSGTLRLQVEPKSGDMPGKAR